MDLHEHMDLFRPAIEAELKKMINTIDRTNYPELWEMLSYHMGWTGEGAGLKTQGKRIRPMITLLTCLASGGEWKSVLPFSASVELIHNFSLLHDDIEDRSSYRHGRKTVWELWGIPQAINSGDLMYSLAFQSLNNVDQQLTIYLPRAYAILTDACIKLTKGQYLDISYENNKSIHIDDYWPMIEGKTAALLACCCELGAAGAGASDQTQAAYHDFGYYLGLAFQVIDDILGLWGDTKKTGKSNSSDLISGKKTFPILYAIENNPDFARIWERGNINREEAEKIASDLKIDGTYDFARQKAEDLNIKALKALDTAAKDNNGKLALLQLAELLTKRDF